MVERKVDKRKPFLVMDIQVAAGKVKNNDKQNYIDKCNLIYFFLFFYRPEEQAFVKEMILCK